ncbi:hypothetical protein [Halostagnicola kamekurae]|nr:hypothetical protein [Halostagnicola kamekurae]
MSIWDVETRMKVVPVVKLRAFSVMIPVVEFLGPDDIEAARL